MDNPAGVPYVYIQNYTLLGETSCDTTEGTIIYLRSCHQASQIQFIDVVERLNCATQSAGFRPGSTDLGRQGCSRWQTCDSNR